VLPGHHLDRARAAIDALTQITPERVRVLPTTASTPLLRLVAAHLPEAEILPPCPSNARLRELALVADVVLCADPDDSFERCALVAAGAGAAVVCAAGGPAHAVLGDQASVFAAGAELRAALHGALARPHSRRDRAARAHAVERLCSERACGERIAALLSEAELADAA
jgi:hypothetical protein